MRWWPAEDGSAAEGTGIVGAKGPTVTPYNIPDEFRDSALGRDEKGNPYLTPSALRGGYKSKQFWSRVGRGLSAGAYRAGYNVKGGAIKGAKKFAKSGVRFARRAAVGAAGAIPMAMLAAGVGATTGDASKAATLMAAAGMTGYNFTNYYGDKAAGTLAGAFKGVSTSAQTAYWGTDAKKIEQYKFDKEFMESPETLDALTKALGSRTAAREAIRDGSVQALLNSNITDPSKVAKALKQRNKYLPKKPNGEKWTPEEQNEALVKAISMAQWHRDLNPAVLVPMSEQQNEFRESMRKRGFSNKQIDEIIDDIDYYNT